MAPIALSKMACLQDRSASNRVDSLQTRPTSAVPGQGSLHRCVVRRDLASLPRPLVHGGEALALLLQVVTMSELNAKAGPLASPALASSLTSPKVTHA